MKLRNVNPLGHVDVPLLGRQGDNGEYAEEDERGYAERTPTPGSGCLEPGEEFDATEDQARQLLRQVGNFEPADDEARRLLDQMADEARPEAQAALIGTEGGIPTIHDGDQFVTGAPVPPGDTTPGAVVSTDEGTD